MVIASGPVCLPSGSTQRVVGNSTRKCKLRASCGSLILHGQDVCASCLSQKRKGKCLLTKIDTWTAPPQWSFLTPNPSSDFV